MSKSAIGRVVAAVAMGTAFSMYWKHDESGWIQRGRDAYLAYHAHRFDKFASSQLPPVAMWIGAVILFAIVLGVYELIALAVVRVLGERNAALGGNSSAAGNVPIGN